MQSLLKKIDILKGHTKVVGVFLKGKKWQANLVRILHYIQDRTNIHHVSWQYNDRQLVTIVLVQGTVNLWNI
jgi:hypothetical protein